MKILITGGAGFIGSHLVKRLISKGNFVTVLDNLERGDIKFLKENNNLKFIFCDLRDYKEIEKYLVILWLITHLRTFESI